MRVLLTGVSGFVGGAAGQHLRTACGHHVIGISRSPPRQGATDDIHPLDIRHHLPAHFGGVDVVIHAAALATPWASPSQYQRVNVDGTANVLDLAQRSGARHFIFISSSSVFYNHGDQWRINETADFPKMPVNAYAASKIAAERLVRESSLPSTILRPRAVFGAGDTVLFPRILRAARAGMLPRFVRGDGARPVGDLISIDNLVHFIGCAVDREATGDYNLTDGQPVDIYGFLDDILLRLGLPLPRRSVSVATAMLFAGMLEGVSRYLLGWREPPLTRFGVSVFSQSKTFDIGKAVAAFGSPPVATELAVQRFVAWQRERDDGRGE